MPLLLAVPTIAISPVTLKFVNVKLIVAVLVVVTSATALI
jgi:hypothetical protein